MKNMALNSILKKAKKMNKGGECYSKGGIIDEDLEPDTDGDVFEDKDWLESYDDGELEKPKKDKSSFVRSFFTSRAVRRK